MAFTQLELNYATEYSKAMANAYPYWSYFSDLYGSPNSATYKPVSGKAVAVQSMTTSGARAVNRDQITGTFNRNFNTSEQILTMRMDREWDTLADPMDIQEDPIVNIANITKTFNEFQKVPEMDAYAASALAQAASGFGGVDDTSLTADNILETWDTYLAYMVNQRVPRDRIRAKMTPDTYKLLKEAAGITRFVEADTGIRNIDRNVGKLDGVVIMEVPKDIMMSAYDFTEGWASATGAKQINLLMFDPIAIAAPVVYETSMMSAPTAQSKGKWLYYERYYYDVFALNQRLPGIFVNMASNPALGTLNITTSAGADSTHTVINGLAPAPYGMKYVAKTNTDGAVSVTYGQALTGWTDVTNGTSFTTKSGDTVTVALVNTTKGNIATASGSALAVVGA
jgi:hypothetical protein